ncbi:MAG: nitroreductase family protein [Proteobacteria bacterium]|nr:nitroreductase family protein [Pseudomonadota bacterium]
MMDLINTIKERRSVRNFSEKNISEDILNHLLESVRWSPSWANTQCWEIIIIKDSTIRENLKNVISPKNPATKSIISAPLLFAVCGKKNSAGFYKDIAVTQLGDWMMFDLGIAVQSLCLAAHSLGLGTVIVGSFDHAAAGKILQVPSGYETIVLVPAGYPEKIPSPPKRREIIEFVHHDVF